MHKSAKLNAEKLYIKYRNTLCHDTCLVRITFNDRIPAMMLDVYAPCRGGHCMESAQGADGKQNGGAQMPGDRAVGGRELTKRFLAQKYNKIIRFGKWPRS